MFAHFLKEIVLWYKNHKRDLPWRHTQDPYLIWLSEIILQQTRVSQGLPYYYNFSEKYPTVVDFANAPIDEILRVWQGLGYYSRARNMHFTAQLVRDQYDGIFPNNYDKLIKLKGVGAYTAAAISSFAANEKHAVVDGNVYRVLSRYFNIDEPINSTKGPKIFANLAQDIIQHTDQNGLYNQAIMEFGAMLCKPAKPECLFCPIQATCVAFEKGKVEQLPVKLKKLVVKDREILYLVKIQSGHVMMKKRGDGDIWNGLYDFIEWPRGQPITEKVIFESEVYIHKLTHQRLQIKFIVCEVNEEIENETFRYYNLEDAKELPKPILIKKFIETLEKKSFFEL